MEVSKNIRSIRERLGLTQVDLAQRLNTERSNYARLENRDVNLTVKQVDDIAKALGVSIMDILGTPTLIENKPDQSELLKQKEERLKITQELLRSSKRDIKYFKQVMEWLKDRFELEFSYIKLVCGNFENFDEDFDVKWEINKSKFQELSESELKKIGERMFQSDLYFISAFLASSGFITDKWFIDAYKKESRKKGQKVSPSEAINYIQGVFELMNTDE